MIRSHEVTLDLCPESFTRRILKIRMVRDEVHIDSYGFTRITAMVIIYIYMFYLLFYS